MTPPLARGIICHTALEEVFDLSPQNRSLENLENLFRRGWSKVRGDRGEGDIITGDDDDDDDDDNNNIAESKEDNDKRSSKDEEYDVLFRDEDDGSANIEDEIEWGKSSLELLQNYYDLEDPRTVLAPNPLMREMWVNSRFPSHNTNHMNGEFIVRGKIDRIDILPKQSSSSDKIQLQIIDYKTGKAPYFKYSQSTNDRIAQEQFWKMKVYALVLWRMICNTDKQSQSKGYSQQEEGQEKDEQKDTDAYKYRMSWFLQQKLMQALPQHAQNNPKWSDIVEINSLRLMYFTSHLDDASINESTTMTDGRNTGKAKYRDFQLGSSPSEFHSFLDQIEGEVEDIESEIRRLVDEQSPHAFKHCDWRYCSCHELRRKFIPGSVYLDPELL